MPLLNSVDDAVWHRLNRNTLFHGINFQPRVWKFTISSLLPLIHNAPSLRVSRIVTVARLKYAGFCISMVFDRITRRVCLPLLRLIYHLIRHSVRLSRSTYYIRMSYRVVYQRNTPLYYFLHLLISRRHEMRLFF